jgi:hypothetical protein
MIDNLLLSETYLYNNIVASTRPNFTKVAPMNLAIHDRAGKGRYSRAPLVHAGLNYEFRMSDDYFVPIVLPYPDINLELGSGSHPEPAEVIAPTLELLFETKWKSLRILSLWGGQTTPRNMPPLEQLLASQ